jgi:hypothetical protein
LPIGPTVPIEIGDQPGLDDVAAPPPQKPRDKSRDERRSARRAFLFPLTARIISLDGTHSFRCKVYDVSQAGAQLAIADATKIPDRFVLALSSHGNARRNCKIVWRTAKTVGVRFVPETTADVAATPPASSSG